MSPSKSDSVADPSKSPRLSTTHLCPPATIISPPSPTDTKDFHSPSFTFPPQLSPAETSSEPLEYDSPEEENDSDTPPPAKTDRQQPPADAYLGTELKSGRISDFVSESPRADASLRLPESPGPPELPTRSPSPSSPRYRPKGLHHRRTSSTHRVRETTNGKQRSTEDGQRMINQYRIGKSLGKGAYATVELAIDVGTGTEYAIKEFSKSRLHYQALQEKHRQNTKSRMRRSRDQSGLPSGAAVRRAGEQVFEGGENRPWGGTQTIEEDPLGLIRREVAVMKKLDHPNLVHLFEAISVPSADALFLVLEYLPGGTLMSVQIGEDDSKSEAPYSTWQTREYFRQLCLGLEYLHANEVVHRDIKPDNVLLSADRQLVKLCDFGVSEMFTASGDDRIKKSGGSPAFLSPESFTSHQHDLHGKAVDIWALGVTLYCMLTGKLPFNVPTPMELFNAVREKSPFLPNEWEPSQKDLIQKMLDKDPRKRIVMSDLREHPWVTDDGKEPMIETEENLFEVGKQVEEPTQEELKNAIGSLRGIFTVIRAVQKMRRLRLHRQSISGSSIQRPHSPGSGAASLASGSMDSYASHEPGTSATSVSDETDDANYQDIAGETVMSPRAMSLALSPSKDGGAPEKMEGLTPLKTDADETERGVQEEQDRDEAEDKEGVVMVDSPVSSDDEFQKTPVTARSK